MKNRLFTLLIVAVVAQAAPAVTQVFAGDFRCLHCPHCNEKCELKVTKEKEKKTAWDVECKRICIPPVRFPWQPMPKACGCADGGCADVGCCDSGCGKSCAHNKCGHVKTVRVLKKESYECPKCKYTWSPADKGCCAGGGCTDLGCTDAGEGDVIIQESAQKQQYDAPAPAAPVYQYSSHKLPTPAPQPAAQQNGYFPPVRLVPSK